MRKEYRNHSNTEYWDKRWTREVEDEEIFADISIYPAKYAEMLMDQKPGLVAELGCGLGRVLKHYHNQNMDIIGIERSRVALERINQSGDYKILAGDIFALPFRDESLDMILAFGLYHNIQEGLQEAVRETARCMKVGSRFCISIRPDNFEMKINELFWRYKASGNIFKSGKEFHKWLLKKKEFESILAKYGLSTAEVHYARNMSILWRIPMLRSKKAANAISCRSGGYTLNLFGRLIDYVLRKLFPFSFCNVMVYIGQKSNTRPQKSIK